MQIPSTLPAHARPSLPQPALQSASTGQPIWKHSDSLNWAAGAPSQGPQLLVSAMGSAGFPLYMYQLANGHRVLIENRPSDMISLRTFVNAGSILEQSIKPSGLYGDSTFRSGIAHLDEHCHFLSTRNYPNLNDWVKTVERYGTRINASTSPEIIQHEMVFNKEDLQAMISMHADAIMNPLYRPEQIGQEKVNVINEMSERTLLAPNRVGNAVWDMLFDRPGFQTLGRPEDVQQTTSEELTRFFQRTYVPQNMVTVISGNIPPTIALGILDRSFGRSLPRAAERPNAGIRMALAPGQIRSKTIQDPELTQSLVHFGFPAPARTSTRERIAMECLDHILFNRNFGMITELMLHKTGMASDLASSMLPMKYAGMFEVLMQTKPGKEREVSTMLLSMLDQVNRGGIQDDQLERAKGMMMSLFRKSVDNAELVTNIVGEEALQGNLNYYVQYPDILKSITVQDLIAVSQRYLTPRSYVVAYGVPGDSQKVPGNPFAGEVYPTGLPPQVNANNSARPMSQSAQAPPNAQKQTAGRPL